MADLEKLVLTIEARTAQFEKALKKIDKNTASFSDSSSRHFKKSARAMAQLEKRFERFGRNSARLLGGALITKASSEIVGGLDDVLVRFDKIAKQSTKVGLTTDALQELRYAGKLTDVEVRTLDLAMQRFSRRVGEAAQGTGQLAKKLNENGIAIFDSAGEVRNLEDILNDYADAIQRAGSDQERLALAFAAFDSEGAALVNTLRNGAAGLAEMRQEGVALGAVIGNDLIRDAEILNDEYTRVITSLSAKWQSFVVTIARTASSVGGYFKEDFEKNDIDLREGIKRLTGNIERKQQILANARSVGPSFTDVLEPLGLGNAASIKGLEKQIAEMSKKRKQLELILYSRKRTEPQLDIDTTDLSPSTNARSASVASPSSSLNQAQDVIQGLRDEAAQLGRTSDAQELYNALQSAGVSLESRQGQAIKEAVLALQQKRTEIDLAKAAQDQLEQQTASLTQSLNSLAAQGFNALEGTLTGVSDLETAFKNLALQIASAAAQSALFGGGSFEGLFTTLGGSSNGALGQLNENLSSSLSSLFSGVFGKREFGGNVLAGRPYFVGEKRPELFIPSSAGRIEPRPQHQLASNARQIGPSVVHMTVHANDAASFQQSQGQIAASLARAVGRGQRNL